MQRTKHPFWETSLNIRIPKNHLEQEQPRDWVQEIRDCANSRININPDPGGWWHRSYVEATQAALFVVYWDTAEKKDVSVKVTISSSGDTGLGHDETDENIKRFFREIKLLRACGNEEQDDSDSETDGAATQAA
ncbi:MAG: hypothetical protein IPI58_08780 [Alphaproteobacteria bacterium]|nr:MAG: hypothetical protein IPI58_08780 [Alphaproteobacteria bacterium]